MATHHRAEEVREHLSAFGWTHAQLGDVLGVGRVTVSRWATGVRDPGTRVLRHLRMMKSFREQAPDIFQLALQAAERGDG